MTASKVDQESLTITGAHEGKRNSNVDILLGTTHDETIIVVTQAYGPDGDNLVGISDVTFDGHPAVTVGVRADGREGVVHMSPIHGDRRKEGLTDIPAGTHLEIFCPVCKKPLPRVGEVEDGSGAGYYALYLTPRLEDGAMVMITDIWGHFHSRIIDDMELISYWAATHGDS